jgi:lipopolysaccharide assembly outer membrane protein LptD (OstA)
MNTLAIHRSFWNKLFTVAGLILFPTFSGTALSSASLPNSSPPNSVPLSSVSRNAFPEGGQPNLEKNEPLIMENADRFEGYRSRGEYVLSGKVRFRHGTLKLETERAVWLKDRNIVYCESGIRIVQRGAVLTGDGGNYDKNRGEAMAEGHVFMRDSSGQVEA